MILRRNLTHLADLIGSVEFKTAGELNVWFTDDKNNTFAYWFKEGELEAPTF